jgi:membrane protein DedA with SNARE-associated domain
MNRFVEWFLSISSVWAVAAVFLVPALETAIVLGLMFPGEVTVILGGVLAAQGDVPLLAILFAGVLGPMTGDTIGYALGRRYGEEVVRRKLHKRWTRAHGWLSKRGGAAIFLGRFLPFLRSVLPTAAGAMGLRSRRFLSWDLPAAAAWGVASVLLGYFAARDFERLLRIADRFGIALGAIALAAAAWILWRRFRARRPSRRSPGPLARLRHKGHRMKSLLGGRGHVWLLVAPGLGIAVAASAAILEGSASGQLIVGGKKTPIRYAYARAEKGFFDPTKEDIRVILSDVSLTEEALSDDFTRNRMARDGKLHSVEVVIDSEKRPISGVLRHPAFARTQGFVSVSGMHRFDPKKFDGRFVEGTLSTDRPGEFMSVSFEYAATFQAAIWRTPGAPGPRPSPSPRPRERKTPANAAANQPTHSLSVEAVLTKDRSEGADPKARPPAAV